MKQDAETYVKKCDMCQRHAPIPHMPSKILNPITSLWLFAQWRMDIVGPLLVVAAQNKFLLMATDYFSKWAEAYACIKDKDVTKLGGGVARRLVGLPDDAWRTDRKHFFRSSIRDGSSYPHENRYAHNPNHYTGSEGQRPRTWKTSELGERSKGKCIYPDGLLLADSSCPLQPEGQSPCLQGQDTCPLERSLKIQSKRKSRSSRQTRKDPTLSQRWVKLKLIICKS